jgi:glycine/serine hydroxymethyltransferase
VDYNLYRKHDIELVEENGIVDYDKLKPSITTLRGKVIKCNDSYFTHPGYGKELEIKIPGYFL